MKTPVTTASDRLDATWDRLERRMQLNTYLMVIILLLIVMPPLLNCPS